MVSVPELRTAVRMAVLAREPVDAREAEAIPEFLGLLGRLPSPFDEHADPVHVTASAIVVGARGVLLHRHKRLGLWLQMGGHIEPGETPWDAAVREATEETGLAVRHAHVTPALVHVDIHPGPRGHTHLDLRYLLVADDQDPAPPEGESQDVAWFGWDDARAVADPGLAGALAALQPVSLHTVRIRPARAADAPALAELYLRSRRHALPSVANAHADDDIRRWVAEALILRSETWLAEVAGVPVGLLVCDGEWVEQLYLDPPWVGRGIGTLLLDQAKALSPTGLQLWTFEVNAGARAFYARHGFVEAERTDGSGNEERQPDVRMVWQPSPG